jgi:hypothetical protein
MVDVDHNTEEHVVVVKRAARNGGGVEEKKVQDPIGAVEHPWVTGVVNMMA